MKEERGHTLRVLERGIDYEILHPDDCPTSVYMTGFPEPNPVTEYDCLTGYLLAQVGLEDNGVDWKGLAAGEYPLVATSGWLPTNGGAEWEAYLELAAEEER